MITFRERDNKISRSEVRYVQMQNSNSKTITDFRQIVMLRKQTKVPRAPTIEKAHIERAFVCGGGDPGAAIAERERIEAYGALNEAAWIGMGAAMRRRTGETPAVPAAVWGMAHQGAVLDDVRMPAGMDRKGVNLRGEEKEEIPTVCEFCRAESEEGMADGTCPNCGSILTIGMEGDGLSLGEIAEL